MDVTLKESVYAIELSGREMGKLRKLRNIDSICARIINFNAVRGITFTSDSVEIIIHGDSPRCESVLGRVTDIIEDQLI